MTQDKRQEVDAHPRLQVATRSIEAANAALRLAIISNRDSPELGVVAGRNRDIRVQVGSLGKPEVRKEAFSWLAERVNTFVRVLRPRMRSAAADYQSRAE
jgi:hypothetical protein